MRIIFKTKMTATALLLSAALAVSVQAQSLTPKQDAKKATWGYVNGSSDKWTVKPQFEQAEEFREMPNGKMRAFVTKKGKKGLIDEQGKMLGAGAVFEETTPMRGDAMLVTVKGKKGVVNYDGVYLVKPEIESLEPLGDEGFIASVKGKKGVLGHDGVFVVDPLYKDIDTSLDKYFVVDKGGKAGLLSRDGKSMLIEPKEFTSLEPFGDYWKVFKDKKVGLYDLTNSALYVKPEYADLRQPIKYAGITLFPVADSPEKWGLLTLEGKDVVKKKFSDIVNIQSLGAMLLLQGSQIKNVYFPGDKKACKVGEYKATQMGPFRSYSLRYDKNWAWHDLNILVLPDGNGINGSEQSIKKVSNRYFYLDTPDGSPLYDNNGKIVLPLVNDTTTSYNNWTLIGNKAVSPDGDILDWEAFDKEPIVIDQTGKRRVILPSGKLSEYSVNSYTPVKIGKEKMAIIQSEQKWGITQGSDIILPFDYDKIEEFKGSKLCLSKDGKAGLYELSSKEWMIEPNYESIYKLGKLIAVGKNGKVGLYSPDKKQELLKADYDSITVHNVSPDYFFVYAKNEYAVHSGNRTGLFDGEKGKWLITLSRGYQSIDSVEGLYDKFVSRNGKYGVVSGRTYEEIVPPSFNKNNIAFDSHIYICKDGSKKRYFIEDEGEVTPTPKVINYGLTGNNYNYNTPA